MKKILALIAALLVTSTAFAEFPGIRNEAGTTHTGTEGGFGPLAMDRANRLISGSASGSGDFASAMSITPIFIVSDAAEAASTTTVVVASAHVARVGDYIEFTSGTAANIGVWRRVASVATNSITLAAALPATAANTDGFYIYRPQVNASVYQEDAATAAGTMLQMIGGINARSFTAFNSTSGDATPMSVGDKGVVAAMIMYDSSLAGGSSPVVPEDVALGASQALVVTGTQMQDPLTVDAATGDASYNKVDLAGRTVVTLAPASERWSACSASNTGTSDTAIKALVASNKICVTSLSCFNTATVASSFEIKSSGTAIYAGGISNSTLAGVAYWEHSFPTPICTAVGEALNFDMATNATATTCCGAGFITTN